MVYSALSFSLAVPKVSKDRATWPTKIFAYVSTVFFYSDENVAVKYSLEIILYKNYKTYILLPWIFSINWLDYLEGYDEKSFRLKDFGIIIWVETSFRALTTLSMDFSCLRIYIVVPWPLHWKENQVSSSYLTYQLNYCGAPLWRQLSIALVFH